MKRTSQGDGLQFVESLGALGEGVVFEHGVRVFHPENVHIGDDVYVGHDTILKGYYKNALIIGLMLGFIVNLGQISLPVVLVDGIDLMARAALPVALFGLGGVLYRYRPEGDMRTVAFMCAVSLILHPSLVWGLAGATGLGLAALQSAIVTSAMPPGVNAYILANMYGVAKRVTATTVLVSTCLAVVSASFWLAVLP